MAKSSSSRTSRKAPAETGVNDTPQGKAKKPKKPRPDFPLFPHASGRWAKKIRGQMHYFGYWARRKDGALVRVDGDGWQEAKKEYDRVIDALLAGRARPEQDDAGGLTVAELCDRFLVAKLRKLEANELTPRLFAEYKEVTDLCVKSFGACRLVDALAADDFGALRATMAQKWGPVRLGNSITRIKSVFKFGYESGLMERPVRYGPEFAKPDKATLRKHRAKKPAKMFEADELRALIDGALVVGECGPELVRPEATLRAMILLGVNCGFGNTDCAALHFTGLDIEGGWIDFPRPKTGIGRRCPLWPETVEAIRAATAEGARPKPSGYTECGLVFLTTRGNAYVTHTKIEKTEAGVTGGARKDLVGIQFGKLMAALGIRRAGVAFYSLRHVFETVAGGAKDQVAVDHIMGHADPSMAAHYREGIEDERLRAVAEHVRKWLFGDAEAPGASKGR